MNEIYDSLLIRLTFVLFFCLVLFAYRYLHLLIYPRTKQQILKSFNPILNHADTIHFFSRLIGFAIIFTQFDFVLQNSLFLTLLDFFVKSICSIVFYLLSCSILESIILYNYLYEDEILKKKNLSYAIISMTHSISSAYLIKIIFQLAIHSIPFLTIIWMILIILLGLISKSFNIYSKIPLYRCLSQKDISSAISYVGYMSGCVIILSTSLNHQVDNLQWYLVQFILKVLLSIIFLPLVIKSIHFVLKIRKKPFHIDDLNSNQLLSISIYESLVFFSACLFVVVITNQISFNHIYY